jgi:hypothetical protein
VLKKPRSNLPASLSSSVHAITYTCRGDHTETM